ncbi:hypothetical protein PHMEG_0003408 [Phytophthora megakarya]|uniref:Uncharacterized protein n=1 Tax=Phytophthora megakarya TaxID=4795 RepID=A0A225WWF8_9STRA|nr:hypothetical protein PHMEG_0003408 [Phytophthora megakarya]
MVRVAGTSGDSGFYSEYQEDVKVKEEHMEEVSINPGSTEASLNTPRSTDQRRMERVSADRHEADLDQDLDLGKKLEFLSRPPWRLPIDQAYYWKILSETMLHDPVLAIIQVPHIGDLTGLISKPNTSTDRLNAVKIMLDLLQESGLVAGEFVLDSLFEMELGAIQVATLVLYELLKIIRETRVKEVKSAGETSGDSRTKRWFTAESEPSDAGVLQHRPPFPTMLQLWSVWILG